METVSKAVRKEMVESVRGRYERSSKLEKGAILGGTAPPLHDGSFEDQAAVSFFVTFLICLGFQPAQTSINLQQ
jgi:hypothetical protein